jgi:hypothetical protein
MKKENHLKKAEQSIGFSLSLDLAIQFSAMSFNYICDHSFPFPCSFSLELFLIRSWMDPLIFSSSPFAYL